MCSHPQLAGPEILSHIILQGLRARCPAPRSFWSTDSCSFLCVDGYIFTLTETTTTVWNPAFRRSREISHLERPTFKLTELHLSWSETGDRVRAEATGSAPGIPTSEEPAAVCSGNSLPPLRLREHFWGAWRFCQFSLILPW